MSFHREMLKDRKVNRQDREVVAVVLVSHLVLLLLVVAVVLAGSTAIGQLPTKTPAADESTESPDKTVTPTFPFMAEITGDNVLFRSGPGTNFYECGKLNKGDKVKVVSKQFSWYRIVPPAKSFAWISMQYVKLDPAKPGYGIVTGDRVRVYAGSDRVKPHYSTSLLGKLNKGERVKLLGQQLDDYYKIAPPAATYLWVSAYFTRPLPPEKKIPAAKEDKPLPAGTGPEVVKIDASSDPAETTVAPLAPKPTVAEKVTLLTPLERYQALQKLIEAETKKPLKEQDYTQIKKDLAEIANDENADKVAIYARKVLQRVEGLELAVSVMEKVRLHNEQLEKTNASIEKKHAAKLAEIENMGKFAVTGKLRPFTLYGKGHYLIVDDSGKMLCYALPSKQVKQMNISSLIGKKVGLKGMIQPHLPTKKAMVRFTEIAELQ
ncbi:MAG: SH3 domain-containing protein [Phycisphaerales bacterium]|nr:MAG: SH3 domain-containing protein [Phycisphaerales bacterium]